MARHMAQLHDVESLPDERGRPRSDPNAGLFCADPFSWPTGATRNSARNSARGDAVDSGGMAGLGGTEPDLDGTRARIDAARRSRPRWLGFTPGAWREAALLLGLVLVALGAGAVVARLLVVVASWLSSSGLYGVVPPEEWRPVVSAPFVSAQGPSEDR